MPIIKKAVIEFAMLTKGRYSTPYLLRNVVSAKLLKRTAEFRIKKRRRAVHIKSPISSSYTFSHLPINLNISDLFIKTV
jgi:hypothetical protein